MCMYYCECKSLGGIGIGAYTGIERSQQATTGQGSDSVTRKEKEQGISALGFCNSAGREFHKEKVE